MLNFIYKNEVEFLNKQINKKNDRYYKKSYR